MAESKKSWPFQGKSLFLVDVKHDEHDRKVWDHVLASLRKDFGVEPDEKDARWQILLDEVVDLYTKMGVLRSLPVPEKESDKVLIELREENLRNALRRALKNILDYTQSKKVVVSAGSAVERAVASLTDE